MTKSTDLRLKQLKKRKVFLQIISFLLTLGPLITFCCIGIFDGDIALTNKLVLTLTIIVAGMLTLINMIKKYHLRSPFFILLLGLYFTLNQTVTFMTIFSCCVVVDEFFISPAINNLKDRIRVRDEMGK